MGDVLDLRQFRAAQLDAVLQAEAQEWLRELLWDYGPSIQLIRQYIDGKILPGYVLAADGTLPGLGGVGGYGFFVYEAHKGLLGDLFVHPDFRRPRHAEERRILMHLLETLQNTPGLRRVEAQLMAYRPGELTPVFVDQGFEVHRRLFLHLPLDGEAAAPAYPAPADSVIEPWPGTAVDEAARLINRAYASHIDATINDQYRSFSGSARFINNVVHYPGCGLFDEQASFVARAPKTGTLRGLIMTSKVRPDVGHITQVCVDPSLQSAGLGRALIEHTAARLRQTGCSAITLTVTAANHRALHLYRQLHFQTLREFDAHVWTR